MILRYTTVIYVEFCYVNYRRLSNPKANAVRYSIIAPNLRPVPWYADIGGTVAELRVEIGVTGVLTFGFSVVKDPIGVEVVVLFPGTVPVVRVVTGTEVVLVEGVQLSPLHTVVVTV